VHRHQHLKRGSVYALSSELETWQRGRELLFRAGGSIPGVRLNMAPQESSSQAAQRSESEPFDRLRDLAVYQGLLVREISGLLAQNALARNRASQLRTYIAAPLPKASLVLDQESASAVLVSPQNDARKTLNRSSRSGTFLLR